MMNTLADFKLRCNKYLNSNPRFASSDGYGWAATADELTDNYELHDQIDKKKGAMPVSF